MYERMCIDNFGTVYVSIHYIMYVRMYVCMYMLKTSEWLGSIMHNLSGNNSSQSFFGDR